MINVILHKLNLHLSKYYPRTFERIAVKGKNLIGAEIGVYKGEHAESLLRYLDIKRLYLIDPFEEYKENGIVGGNFNGKEYKSVEEVKLIAHNNIKSNKVIWIEKKSQDCIDEIPKLDFIYIDGSHDYESVKRDIENYYPKIKEGGVMGGHDICNCDCKELEEVSKAVIEFAVNNNLILHISDPDWWIIKKI